MMGNKKYLFPFFLVLSCQYIWAKEVVDTLKTTKDDQVIVTYDISQNNGQIIINFHDVRKILGKANEKQYKDLSKVVTFFFDRTGNYGDNMEFSGISPDAFMIPKEVNYELSKDGYFLLNNADKPSLSLELKTDEDAVLSIPLFLAHYEGKHRYKVFSRCEDLAIKLSKKKQKPVAFQEEVDAQERTQTITYEEELDEADVDELTADNLINRIYGMLAEQEKYPFSDELKQAIARLREISYRPIDSKLALKIDEVLADYKIKEEKLKAEYEKNIARIAEEQRDSIKKEQARQDSINAAAQQQAKEERKQNLWLIIGGVLLAVLAFIGNQTLQHFRNVKNQKSMMAMQQNALKRAQDEAKRRARNMTRSQINRVQGEARRQTNKAINDSIKKIGNKGKGNKGFSI